MAESAGGIRVLVCGGRGFSDHRAVWNVLDELHDTGPIEAVINGDAQGVDRAAGMWTKRLAGLRDGPIPASLIFPADWRKHGKTAGPIRNQQMLDEGKPDLVIAFPGGRGTADMVRCARAAGVPVQEVHP